MDLFHKIVIDAFYNIKGVYCLLRGKEMDHLKNFSQELRNPVNSIIGLNEMILRECRDENIVEYAKGVEKSALYLKSLLDDFHAIENIIPEINEVDYKLSELAKSLYNQFSYEASDKGLSLELILEGELPEDMIGDEAKIKKLIGNLVKKSISDSESGCIQIRFFGEGTIELSKPYCINITVSDTGRGLPVKTQGDMLNMDEQLCMALGGNISFESTIGTGTIASVTIPQYVSSFNKAENIIYSKSREEDQLENRKVLRAPGVKLLVVDDTLSNLKIISLLMKRTGIEVVTAQDGLTALELIGREHFDGMFLDIMMPKMDGIEVLRRINDLMPDRGFPVIALTANVDSGAMDDYLARGFDDYLPKPVDAERIEKLLVKWLPSHKITYS